MTSAFQVAVQPAHEVDSIELLWRDLETRATPSFFVSWHWIGTLLESLHGLVTPELLTVRANGTIVGLAVLVPTRHLRHGFVRVTTSYLNETGRPEFDCVRIEHNALLADSRYGASVAHAALSWLVAHRPEWEEFHLGSLSAVTASDYRSIGKTLGLTVLLRERMRADYVDLSAIRAGGKGYLNALSRNTRHQIRRATRLYERTGPVVLTAAASTDEALAYLEGLKALHQPYWNERGLHGAFTPFFEKFHRGLIRRCFDEGAIQLVRIGAGDQVIGYIYCLVAGRTVYQYQSGFHYGDDPKLKPGLVCHSKTISYNLERGADIYDFLSGESQHKTSLGTSSREMDWLVLQRRRLKFVIENGMRGIKRRLVETRR